MTGFRKYCSKEVYTVCSYTNVGVPLYTPSFKHPSRPKEAVTPKTQLPHTLLTHLPSTLAFPIRVHIVLKAQPHPNPPTQPHLPQTEYFYRRDCRTQQCCIFRSANGCCTYHWPVMANIVVTVYFWWHQMAFNITVICVVFSEWLISLRLDILLRMN